MIKKLTLSMEEKVIDRAKKYARQKGKSLLNIVETCLKVLGDHENSFNDISPIVIKLKGVIMLPDGYDYKKELPVVLSKQYKA